MILAGDIGGTNTRLALFDIQRDRLVMCACREFKNRARSGLDEIVREFLHPPAEVPHIACFGVAGPVKDGKADLTNIGWHLDQNTLKRALKIPTVVLINDLVAHGNGIDLLKSKDLLALHKARPSRRGNRALIAPGTGLGEGSMIFDEQAGEYRPIPSEGGHCDFSPRDEREIALLRFVHARKKRCSWEDVLSGPGLRGIWDFFTSEGPFHIDSPLDTRDPDPSDITRAANDNVCPACVAAVEMFVTLLGAEAGNVALKVLATGGVYIGGGIPRHMLKFLHRPALVEAFSIKGPPEVRQLLRDMPIYLILSEHNALWGAAHHAQSQQRPRKSARK